MIKVRCKELRCGKISECELVARCEHCGSWHVNVVKEQEGGELYESKPESVEGIAKT